MATVYGTAPMVHTTTQAVHEQAVAPVAAVVQPQLTVQAQALPTIAVPVAAPAVVATAPVQSMMEVKNAKIEEDAQKKLSEYSNLSHEEHMSISGSNARYMVMQKLSRKSEVHNYPGTIVFLCLVCIRVKLKITHKKPSGRKHTSSYHFCRPMGFSPIF